MCVDGREVGRDELAVCDLCGSDDEDATPKWEIKKKPCIIIDN
jgi:hypothetical protein